MTDYSSVTEAPRVRVTPEAASMLLTRYRFASGICSGKDVLEVGCASGMGLGYLARSARSIIGGDYTESLLLKAQAHYRGRVPLVRFDAHTLPFGDASFDVVILFETIYYLIRPQNFFRECHRVLREEGFLLLCSVNKEWEGFNPSPLSTRYFSSNELQGLLEDGGFRAEIFSAFSASARTFPQRVVAKLRKAAVRFNLFPRTMSGKETLKRLFYGRLVELGEELEDGVARIEPLSLISNHHSVGKGKVLYALGHRIAMVSVPR